MKYKRFLSIKKTEINANKINFISNERFREAKETAKRTWETAK